MSGPLHVLALVGLLSLGIRGALAVSLAWDPSPSEEVVGYEIHVGYTPGQYDYAIDVGETISWPMPPLAAGRTHYFAVSAYDASGERSALSNEVMYHVDAVDMLPPTARITVTPGTGPAPHVVHLSVEASGSIDSYRWDLGDGTTFVSNSLASLTNLAHEYREPGAYSVRFTASGPSGSTLSLQANPVIVTRPEGCPCSLFGASVPRVADGGPGDPINVGLRFRVLTDGRISGLRFYRSPTNQGPHVGTLWSDDGRALASVAFPSGGVPGWQEAALPTPVAVGSGQVLVASYHSPHGHHAQDDGALLRGFSTGHLQVLPYQAGRGNGVYGYAMDPTFPSAEARATNFGVDVLFVPVVPSPQGAGRAARHLR